MSKVLVIGANGTIGQHTVAYLIEQGVAVKAASRSGKAPAGAEGVAFDYTGNTNFDALFDGVSSVYVMVPAGYLNVQELLTPIITEAAKRKVKVVLQTAIGVDADESIPYRQVELALERSGTPYVILRPNWFADNFHTYWLHGVQTGTIAVPAGEGKSSFIDVRDIAASAAAALTHDQFNGKAFNLTGPQALSYGEAATVLSQSLNRTINYKALDDATFVGGLVGAGVPEDYAKFLAFLFYPVRENWTAGVSAAVKELTGKEPRSLQTYVQDNLAKLA
ncbi:NAD(P)H-binding protein [uncultured Thiothrix sp.]|uniref:NmrA family NAD(P)-binding protein n=1 Tax=uncultured Thiothrix sp. TaxID=223185 RepID=UPI0026018DB8|nr:NAD(P)H-binding protein [uncultured Thiothrix sp.]